MPIRDIREEERSTDEMKMVERISALHLQAEEMAQKNKQRQLE